MDKIREICLIAYRVKLFKAYCTLLDSSETYIETYEKLPLETSLNEYDKGLVNGTIPDMINGEECKFFKENKGICALGEFIQEYVNKLNGSSTKSNERERAAAEALEARKTANDALQKELDSRASNDEKCAQALAEKEAEIAAKNTEAEKCAQALAEKEADLAATKAEYAKALSDKEADLATRNAEMAVRNAEATKTLADLAAKALAEKEAELTVMAATKAESAKAFAEKTLADMAAKALAEKEAALTALTTLNQLSISETSIKQKEQDELNQARYAELNSKLEEALNDAKLAGLAHQAALAKDDAALAAEKKRNSEQLANSNKSHAEILQNQVQSNSALQKELEGKKNDITLTQTVAMLFALNILVKTDSNGVMFNPTINKEFKLNTDKWVLNKTNLSEKSKYTIDDAKKVISAIRKVSFIQ